jgi:hypothetical protein
MAFTINNFEVEMWPFRPNWSSSYKVSVEFKTEILTSRSGKEQRRSLRVRPRKKVEFKVTPSRSAYIDLKRLLTRWQNERFVVPEITRSIKLTTDIASGTSIIPVSSVPFWVVVGYDLVIQKPISTYKCLQSVHKVQSVNAVANTITITNATEFDWSAGTTLHPALLCLLSEQTSITSFTSSVGEMTARFDVDPISEPEYVNNNGLITFESREVLTAQPNWVTNPATDFIYPYEQVDFGRGAIETIRPINFSSTSRRMKYLARSPEQAESLLANFMRSRGQRRDFWLESGEADIIPSVPTPANNNIIRIAGKDVFDTYSDDTVHKALFFKMKSGTHHYTRISSVTVVDNDTLITLVDPLNEIVSGNTIVRIAWLRVCRHATDSFTLDWTSQNVAETQMTIRSLEYHTAEN